MIGMRVLVTRSSGRTGKGIVKWKGHLQGHADQFIGIELETPSKSFILSCPTLLALNQNHIKFKSIDIGLFRYLLKEIN